MIIGTSNTRAGPARVRRRLRSILGSTLGNLIEWYDWFAYSTFALYFSHAFFPADDQTARLLKAAGAFAAGFLMRPLGAWLLGAYADRSGRRSALAFSMAMMAFGSLILGLAPNYNEIGFFAPLILVASRVVQGLSVGGEYAISATYLSEMSEPRHRGFWASFQNVSTILGQLSAMAVLLLLQRRLTASELADWGWRIPFLIGAAAAILAMFVMLNIEETDSFSAAHERAGTSKFATLFTKYPRELCTVLGLTMAGGLGFYTFTAYMQKFLVNTTGFSRSLAAEITAGGVVVLLILQPVMGWISDIVGRRPMLIAFGGLGALGTVPILTMISRTHSPVSAFLLIVLALAILSAYTSIGGLFQAELFPTEVRALGLGLPYAFAISTIGGTAEVVALRLKQIGHESAFYWYVATMFAISFVTAVGLTTAQSAGSGRSSTRRIRHPDG